MGRAPTEKEKDIHAEPREPEENRKEDDDHKRAARVAEVIRRDAVWASVPGWFARL
jgi:hypothetical protein